MTHKARLTEGHLFVLQLNGHPILNLTMIFSHFNKKIEYSILLKFKFTTSELNA